MSARAVIRTDIIILVMQRIAPARQSLNADYVRVAAAVVYVVVIDDNDNDAAFRN